MSLDCVSRGPKYCLILLLAFSLPYISCSGAGRYEPGVITQQNPPRGFELVRYIGPTIEGGADLHSPCDIAFDVDGQMFICDNGNHRILKLGRQLAFIKEIGGFGNGNEQLANPIAIVFDNGLTLMVADTQKRRISRFDRNLNFIDFFLEYKSAEAFANIGKPSGIHIGRNGDIYLSDDDNNRVLVLDSFYNLQSEIGGFGYGNGELSSPAGLVTDQSDNLLVADSRNGRIAVYNSVGGYSGDFGRDRLRYPIDIAIDPAGYIYVSDRNLKSVLVFSRSGKYTIESSSYGSFLDEPAGIHIHSDGYIYVADRASNRIAVLNIIR